MLDFMFEVPADLGLRAFFLEWHLRRRGLSKLAMQFQALGACRPNLWGRMEGNITDKVDYCQVNDARSKFDIRHL